MPSLRRLLSAGLALATLGSACGRSPKPLEVTDLLPGSWVQVYPALGNLDTLVLSSSGAVGGSIRGLALTFPDSLYLRWRTDFPPVPGGLCITREVIAQHPEGTSCFGFRLSGDSLFVANASGTSYLRLRPGRAPIAAWSTPHGFAITPTPGDSVHPLAAPVARATLAPRLPHRAPPN